MLGSWLSMFEGDSFLLFTLILCRVSGLTMTAPIYGTNEVPMQIRGMLAVSLAVLIAPTQSAVVLTHPGTMLNYLVFVGSELAIGLCLGLGIMLLFSGIQLAGQVIGRTGGLMLAESVDPSLGQSVPQISRLLYLLALALFVTIGGHRLVMAALLDTFGAIPPGSGLVPVSIAHTFEKLLTQSFVLGMRAGAPAVTAVLLSTLVMGLISRTLPQLNVLMVGFGLNALLTFGMLALSMGTAAWVLQDQVEPALDLILEAFDLTARAEWMN